ncbi:MAG: nitrate reductase cytochrome c-type subunit [Burkholderiales bacterium]|nr:nitrate reductase cytochrome c-type subunit [Burkholderiales bacterium]
MTMKTSGILLSALVAATLLGSAAHAQQTQAPKSLRMDVPVEATSKADSFRVPRDREPYARDFVQQPPLVPHSVQGYPITMNFNKCMDCHSWGRAKESGATKVSLTHFKDREGKEMSNISPRRYFCLQCHVPQTDARPLVQNTFKPVDTLRTGGQ